MVHARTWSTYHELAHTVACEIRTDSLPSLAEGLAVMFEPSPLFHDNQNGTIVRLEEYIAAPYPLDGYYDDAGHFVRWLYEIHGEALADLYVEVGEGSMYSTVSPAFEGLSDSTFEQLEAAYDSHAPHTWVPFRQCEDTVEVELEPDGSLAWSGEVNCDDALTLGPYPVTLGIINAGDVMYRSIAFEIANTTSYRMSFMVHSWSSCSAVARFTRALPMRRR